MQLYFIRHGQSVNNAGYHDPNYEEHPDPPLTELGREQARILADYLKERQTITRSDDWNTQNQFGFGFTHIYTSLMERAAQTAAPTARALGIPFQGWTDLHEEGGIFARDPMNRFTGLPGRPRSYFESNIPELKLPVELTDNGWWNRPFEEEQDRQPRSDRVLSELLARHADREGGPEQRIAFFSHGGFFMRLVSSMLALSWRQASHGLESWFLLNNCSISRFDIRRGEIVLCYMNRTDHLPPHMISG